MYFIVDGKRYVARVVNDGMEFGSLGSGEREDYAVVEITEELFKALVSSTKVQMRVGSTTTEYLASHSFLFAVYRLAVKLGNLPENFVPFGLR